jgi:serine phosphatase RsbU (regulator of sigma subunit)
VSQYAIGAAGSLSPLSPATVTLEMRPGDALVLYGDGLTDTYAPERVLEVDDLASPLAPCAARSASEIADRVPARRARSRDAAAA